LAPLLGARISIALRPWSRTEAAFRGGQLDLIAMVDTDDRRRWAQFGKGHATPALALYRRRERAELQDVQDLTNLRIAILVSVAMRDTCPSY
jgi:ABC-type amino acid transport substrate-binding protein